MKIVKLVQRSILVMMMSLGVALSAQALELDDAKTRGLVGETSTGLLGAVKASSEVDALVAGINQKRKVVYVKIAERNGISLEAVQVRAGQKAIEKTPAGQYINRGSGWEQK